MITKSGFHCIHYYLSWYSCDKTDLAMNLFVILWVSWLFLTSLTVLLSVCYPAGKMNCVTWPLNIINLELVVYEKVTQHTSKLHMNLISQSQQPGVYYILSFMNLTGRAGRLRKLQQGRDSGKNMFFDSSSLKSSPLTCLLGTPWAKVWRIWKVMVLTLVFSLGTHQAHTAELQ